MEMNYSPKIAVIDDQPEFADIFQRYFRNEYTVTGFTDYPSAAAAIRRGEYDAVVLDILMPEKSGLDILKEIKDISNVPVIMVTASKRRDNIIAALRLGADDYLEKPFDFEVIRQRIDEALKKRMVTLPVDIPDSIELAPDQSINLSGLDQRVKMAVALVESNFASPITLHHLSKLLNLAPYYLGRLIKQETGYSFKEILARYRMKQAADMLLSSQQRIKDVARACGFANFHYFCRMFHRFYQHPASRHRKLGRT
jgi:YesN/AraC family two-component response regulator